MARLLLLLCGAIFLTLLIGGREGGAVRYGLVPGKVASLVYDGPEKPKAETLAEAAPAPAPVTRTAAAPAAALIEAAFVEPAGALPAVAQQGLTLTLSLPLTRPGEAVASAPAAEPVAEPVVQYVQGSAVNVRAGPSADTESLTKLGRGEAVLVLPSDTPGWSMIRIEGDGVEGYIASRFLGDRTEDGLFGSVD